MAPEIRIAAMAQYRHTFYNGNLENSIPRVVVFDQKTKTSILQWPVEEVESLRLTSTEFEGVELAPGSLVPLDIGTATDQVDHSVVESFAQGGRKVITLRIYPTAAVYEATRLFLFNNATRASVVASIKVWKMKSASFEDYNDSPRYSFSSI
ncbi:hypothetical protein L1049_020687 [Liquidambar formosana]|uniref:Glycosyl hydrolase family 32 C-terminal domain-containing protein n=1 Tax=Liquidambar formosana TaxID=63359 RepID=A0AAP0SAA9_LIQFO